MAHKIKTIDFPLHPPVSSILADVLIGVRMAADIEPILGVPAASKSYPIQQENVATKVISFPSQPRVFKIEPTVDIPKKTPTYKYEFMPPKTVATSTERVSFESMKGRVRRIVLQAPDKLQTFRSHYLDHAMIGRESIDKRRIPFPALSDFMSELAKRNRTTYTNISFIGAFDPIPLHLAEKIMIDTTFGTLKYHIRKEPKGERRFVRLVYGRKRDTGEIVSAIFPVM
ncbi:MAG: hypothetical protein WCX65_04060 [bacterium]